MLTQRIITALVLLPVVFVILFRLEITFFSASVIVIVYLMALEWAKLSGINNPVIKSFFALAVSSVNMGVWYFSERMDTWPSLSWPHHLTLDLPLSFLLLALPAILLAVVIVMTFSKNHRWWQFNLFKQALALVFLPAFYISLVSVRNQGYVDGDFYFGGKLLLFMFLMIWAADTGAFISGKLLGKHKLTLVSPNKTWEGAIGGLILTCLVGWSGISVLSLTVENKIVYLSVILIIGIISVFGDLFESALKRVANIKDSGSLLPGHGGLLDRLDSSLTVAPVFYLTFSYFEWFNV